MGKVQMTDQLSKLAEINEKILAQVETMNALLFGLAKKSAPEAGTEIDVRHCGTTKEAIERVSRELTEAGFSVEPASVKTTLNCVVGVKRK